MDADGTGVAGNPIGVAFDADLVLAVHEDASRLIRSAGIATRANIHRKQRPIFTFHNEVPNGVAAQSDFEFR